MLGTPTGPRCVKGISKARYRSWSPPPGVHRGMSHCLDPFCTAFGIGPLLVWPSSIASNLARLLSCTRSRTFQLVSQRSFAFCRLARRCLLPVALRPPLASRHGLRGPPGSRTELSCPGSTGCRALVSGRGLHPPCPPGMVCRVVPRFRRTPSLWSSRLPLSSFGASSLSTVLDFSLSSTARQPLWASPTLC